MAPRRTKAELAAELAATQKRLAQLERTQARQAKALRAAQQVEAALNQLTETLEQRVAERAAEVLASERKFETIFEHSPVAMGLVRLSDSRYVDVNNAMLDLLGHAREEVIGKTSEEVGMWFEGQARQHFFEQLLSKQNVSNFEALVRIASVRTHSTLNKTSAN